MLQVAVRLKHSYLSVDTNYQTCVRLIKGDSVPKLFRYRQYIQNVDSKVRTSKLYVGDIPLTNDRFFPIKLYQLIAYKVRWNKKLI